MKLNLNQLASYFYKYHGGKLCQVHIFDKSPMMSFSLTGEIFISLNMSKALARIFYDMMPFMMHPDIELHDVNKG